MKSLFIIFFLLFYKSINSKNIHSCVEKHGCENIHLCILLEGCDKIKSCIKKKGIDSTYNCIRDNPCNENKIYFEDQRYISINIFSLCPNIDQFSIIPKNKDLEKRIQSNENKIQILELGSSNGTCSCSGGGSGGENIPETILGPRPRMNAGFSISQNNIYLFSGLVYSTNGGIFQPSSGKPTLDMWKYSLTNKNWEKLYPLGTFFQSPHDRKIIELNGKLYVFGARVSIYTIGTNIWSTGATAPIDVKQYGITKHQGNIYILGGISGSTVVGNLRGYDPSTDIFTDHGSPIATKLRGHDISIIGNKIYILGFSQDSDSCCSGSEIGIKEYDISTFTSGFNIQVNTAQRVFYTSVVYQSKVYRYGGYNGFENDNYEIFDDIYILTPGSTPTFALLKPENSPYPLAGVSSYIQGDKMTIWGGFDGHQYRNSFITYDLESNKWLNQESSGSGSSGVLGGIIPKTSLGPEGRINGALSLYQNNFIYIFSGLTNGDRPSSDMWKYTLSSKTWERLWYVNEPHDFPHERKMGELDGIIYVFTARVSIFHIATSTWVIAPTTHSLNAKQYGLIKYNNKFYIFGGKNVNSPFNVIGGTMKYDPLTDTLTQASGSPGLMRAHDAVLVGDKVYIVGYTDQTASCCNQNIIEGYNIDTFTNILTVSKPNAGRILYTAIEYQGKVYRFGGFIGQESSGFDLSIDIFDELWVFNPPDQSFTLMKPSITPIGLYGASSYLLNDKITIYGGFDGVGYNKEFLEYDITENKWT